MVGFAAYKVRSEKVRSFTHTEVDDRMEGQGVGGQLVRGCEGDRALIGITLHSPTVLRGSGRE